MSIEELTATDGKALDDDAITALLAKTDAELMEMFKDLLPSVRLIRCSEEKETKLSKPKRGEAAPRKVVDRSRIQATLDRIDKLDI